MNKKNKLNSNGLVYSTNPNVKLEEEETYVETLPPQEQKLRIQLETKHRGGKTATIIFGFVGAENDLQQLEKKLKNFCGTGGSSKNGEIIIQGDQREKILKWLLNNDYTHTKKAGG